MRIFKRFTSAGRVLDQATYSKLGLRRLAGRLEPSLPAGLRGPLAPHGALVTISFAMILMATLVLSGSQETPKVKTTATGETGPAAAQPSELPGSLPPTEQPGAAATSLRPGKGKVSVGGGKGVPSVDLGALGPGIDANTIKVSWVYSDSTCGTTTATGVYQPTYEQAKNQIDTIMKWANKYLPIPGGRKFVWSVDDYGGLFCPEKNRSTALKIVQQEKPFALLGSVLTAGSTPIVADIVTQNGIMAVGWNYRDEELMRQKHPFAWAENGTDTLATKFVIDLVAKRFKDKKYVSPQGLASDRVYGIIGRDDPEHRAVSNTMQAELAKYGLRAKVVQYMDDNPAIGAQQAAAITAKLASEGVNTILWAATVLQSWVLTPTFDSQAYFPDHFVGSTGSLDYPSQAQYNSPQQLKRWYGVTNYFGVHDLRGDPGTYGNVQENNTAQAFRDVWQQMGNQGDPPDFQGPNGAWPQASLFFVGLLAAGPTLNAATFAAGLERASKQGPCLIWRFLGRDHPWAAGRQWNPKVHGSMDKFTPIYWVDKKAPDGTNGYFESWDGYTHFNDFSDLPATPSNDTGVTGPPKPPPQNPPKLGLRPSVSCKSLGLGNEAW